MKDELPREVNEPSIEMPDEVSYVHECHVYTTREPNSDGLYTNLIRELGVPIYLGIEVVSGMRNV